MRRVLGFEDSLKGISCTRMSIAEAEIGHLGAFQLLQYRLFVAYGCIAVTMLSSFAWCQSSPPGLPSEQEPLNWVTRLRIAVGAVKGFNYLHNDCSPAIIHRDVKCSNILLDSNLAAKVADFGLSKLLSQSALTHITTGVKGTFGYLDPEYAQTERLTEKSDVYSFGVILLECLTGNKAIMQHNGEYVHIAQWARPHIITNMTANILDKKLGNNIDKDAVQTVANIAMHCVASKSIERPSFQAVLEVLEAALKQEMKLELPQQTQSLLATDDDIIDIQVRADTGIPIVDGTNDEESLLYSVQKSV